MDGTDLNNIRTVNKSFAGFPYSLSWSLSMLSAVSCFTLAMVKLASARTSSFPAATTFSQLASEPCMKASKQMTAIETTTNALKHWKNTFNVLRMKNHLSWLHMDC